MGDSQLSLIPHFSDSFRKSRVCNRCFSKPFAKVRALLIAEMIDKGEELNQISKVKLNDYNKTLSGRQPTIRSKKKMNSNYSTVATDCSRGTVASNDTVASIDTVARKSIDIVARKSIDTVKGKDLRKTSLHEDRRCLRNIDRQSITSIDRSPLKCVDRQSFKSIDHHLTVLVGTHIKVGYTVFPCYILSL
uniref:Uncharacterized protein n=1 Tax=Brassica oleracea var. oleracea TaxID=109376 RepID=A0A0D2ZWG1_BRAOL